MFLDTRAANGEDFSGGVGLAVGKECVIKNYSGSIRTGWREAEALVHSLEALDHASHATDEEKKLGLEPPK